MANASATGDRTSNRRRTAGFTLLELVLVMFVAAIMLAMALPALRPFMVGRATQNTAGELVAMTRLARSLAISEARVYRVHVDPELGEIWLSHADLPEDEAVPVPTARPITLPAGVELYWQADHETRTRSYIRFHPNGRCDPSVFELIGPQGEPVYVASQAPHDPYALRTAAAWEVMQR